MFELLLMSSSVVLFLTVVSLLGFVLAILIAVKECVIDYFSKK